MGEFLHNFELRQYDSSVVLRMEKWMKELKPVFNELSNVPYAVIKGDVLSIMAYGKSGFRNSADIDILISRKNLPYIETALKKNGFHEAVFDENGNYRELTRKERIMFLNSHQVCPYSKSMDDGTEIPIDINVDIFWGEFEGKRVDIDTFLEDTQIMNLHGDEIKVLPLEKAFIELCLHHYKEMNAPYCFKLSNPFTHSMFQDVYEFYKRHFNGNMKDIYKLAEAYEIKEYIYYMLYYTERVFENDNLKKEMELFRTELAERYLKCYGLTKEEQKEWLIDFYERLDAEDIFTMIKPYLTEKDLKKIDYVLSIFNEG